MVGEVEMSRDWFGSVFVMDRNIPNVFVETVTQSAARFADIYIYIYISIYIKCKVRYS